MNQREITNSVVCFLTAAILVSGCPKKPFVPDTELSDMVTMSVPHFLLSELERPLDQRRYIEVSTDEYGPIKISFDQVSNRRKHEFQIKGKGLYFDIFQDPDKPHLRYRVASAIYCQREEGEIDYNDCHGYNSSDDALVETQENLWLFEDMNRVFRSIDDALGERE